MDDGSLLFEAAKHPSPQQAFQSLLLTWMLGFGGCFLDAGSFMIFLMSFCHSSLPKNGEQHGKIQKHYEMCLIVLGSP